MTFAIMRVTALPPTTAAASIAPRWRSLIRVRTVKRGFFRYTRPDTRENLIVLLPVLRRLFVVRRRVATVFLRVEARRLLACKGVFFERLTCLPPRRLRARARFNATNFAVARRWAAVRRFFLCAMLRPLFFGLTRYNIGLYRSSHNGLPSGRVNKISPLLRATIVTPGSKGC